MTYNDDPEKFSAYDPAIREYLRERVNQIMEYDSEFYQKCIDVVPKDSVLDSESFNSIILLPKVLNAHELKIVKSSIKNLIISQRVGESSAVEIAHAFIRAAILAHVATNCVMEFMIPEALEKAQECDKYLAEHHKVMGPYHGIPISIKEHVNIKGRVTNGSYVAYLKNKPASYNSMCYELLSKFGAVFHIRTSQSQAFMHNDTWNNIIGRTRNPLSTRLSPGGSSGGEAAAVASFASAIGIGSDLSGGIRCPASFCGLYGMKPTANRLSVIGRLSHREGVESIPPVVAPLARSIEDIDYYMSHCINDGSPWETDAKCIPLTYQYKYQLPLRRMKIGVIFDDGIVTPYPSVVRVLESVVQRLKDSGRFEVIPLDPMPGDLFETYRANLQLLAADGNQHQMEMLGESGEPALPLTKEYFKWCQGRVLSVPETGKLNLIRDTYQKDFHNMLQLLNLHFVLSPVYIGPAELPQRATYSCYSSLFNLIDFPAIAFPTGESHNVETDKVSDEIQLYDNEFEQDVWLDGDRIRYNSEDYENAPVGLQLIGRRYEDDKVVAGVRLIEEVLKHKH